MTVLIPCYVISPSTDNWKVGDIFFAVLAKKETVMLAWAPRDPCCSDLSNICVIVANGGRN
jgi:hypothetical protein